MYAGDMDESWSNQYEEPNNGSAGATNLDTEAAEIVNRPDLEGAERERRRRRGRGYNIEAEEKDSDSVSSDSEEEVDEHRLLSASFHTKAAAGGVAGQSSRGHNPAAGANNVNLSDSWNDDDIDPFSYGPPLTKWDYFKVSLS